MIHVPIESSAKEQVEYVVLIELLVLLMISLLVVPREILLRSSLIVYHTLLRVAQARVSLTNLFERLLCLWIAVLIWMYL